MRVATFVLSVLAVVSTVTFAAPINPAHYEELEARWHNPFRNGGLRKLVSTGIKVYKKVAPLAKAVAPLILKREDEVEEMHRRDEMQVEEELHRRDFPGTIDDVE